MSETKHNNLSVWPDGHAGNCGIARKRDGYGTIEIGNMGSDGKPWWLHPIYLASAKSLTAALADLFGVELHPAGTAARLANPQPANAEIPEPLPYTLGAIVGLLCATTTIRLADPRDAGLLERDETTPSPLGLQVFAEVLRRLGIENGEQPAESAERVEEPDDAEPTKAVHMAPCTHCGTLTIMSLEGEPWCHECAKYCGTICDSCGGPMVNDYDGAEGSLCAACAQPTTPAEHDRFHGTPIDLSHVVVQEVQPLHTDPGPQWSEPIEQMSQERCYHVARALGYYIEVRSTFDGADRTYWAFISEWNGLDQDDGPRMATELEAWQSAVVMAARKRDRYDAETDRVDLTGLEVRS